MFRDNWQIKLYGYLRQMEPSEIVGVARLLQVELVRYEGDTPIPHDAEMIMLSIFNKVESMNRARRRKFMSLVKKAADENKKLSTEVDHGATTEDC